MMTRRLRAIAILAVAYFVAAKLGLSLALVSPYATAVWPPTGIALASLVLFGYRLWPGVLIGALAANLTTGGAPPDVAAVAASVGIAIGNTLEALFGTWLLTRFANGAKAFDYGGDVFRFALLAAGVSTIVSATIGVLCLGLTRIAAWPETPDIWLTWWIGDAGGNMIFAPAILIWAQPRRFKRPAAEVAAVAVVVMVLSIAAFTNLPLPAHPAHLSLAFLCIPGLLLAAFRLGRRETAASLLFVTAVAIWGWFRGLSADGLSRPYALLELQAFLGITSLMCLAVAAEVSQRHLHERVLEERNDSLRGLTDQLKDQEKQLRLVIDGVPGLVAYIGRDYRYQFVNRAYYEWFQCPAGAIEGRTVEELLGSEIFATVRPGVDRALAGEPVVYEESFSYPDAAREIRAAYVPDRDPAGNVRGMVVLVQDITEQKRFQEQLQQTQKLESLGVLAGGIAHDFNNLLVGILGNASLAIDSLPPSAAGRPMLNSVIGASENAARLVRQLLAYAGKQPFRTEPVDVSRVVADITSLLHSSIPKTVQLTFQLKSSLPPAAADETQLRQVIMNLVINAAEAIPEGAPGIVSIETSARAITADDNLRAIVPLAEASGDFVVLRVSDTGAGMPPDVKAKVFDPFFTTKFTGRGLGLSAVLGIVQVHRGTITLESKPGQGTTFCVFLPATVYAPQAAPAVPAIDELRGEGTILIVDDEHTVRGMASRTLEFFGYRVITAENGEEAIRVLTAHPEVAAVLLDLAMPLMTGDRAAPELRRVRPAIPIVLSSGYTEGAARSQFSSTGISEFLQKPYTARALASVFARALRGTEPQSEPRP